jgi:hypothetical protein
MNENLDTSNWEKCSHCKKKMIPVQWDHTKEKVVSGVSDKQLKELQNSGKFCDGGTCFLDELLGPIFTHRGGN